MYLFFGFSSNITVLIEAFFDKTWLYYDVYVTECESIIRKYVLCNIFFHWSFGHSEVRRGSRNARKTVDIKSP